MDSLNKKRILLFLLKAFFSTLKNKNITEQEYQYRQQVWSENNMQTFRDFLIWYNITDIQPFCNALEKMCAFWKDKTLTSSATQ